MSPLAGRGGEGRRPAAGARHVVQKYLSPPLPRDGLSRTDGPLWPDPGPCGGGAPGACRGQRNCCAAGFPVRVMCISNSAAAIFYLPFLSIQMLLMMRSRIYAEPAEIDYCQTAPFDIDS